MEWLKSDAWQELIAELEKPFDPRVVKHRAGATNKQKTRALALPYVDGREYERRLDAAAPGAWSVDFARVDLGSEKVGVICKLRIHNIDRSSTGEEVLGDDNALTSAEQQAFKRACSKFGLGRHLYDEPAQWQPYDAKRKQIVQGSSTAPRDDTDDAIAAYQAEQSRSKPQPKPQQKAPPPPQKAEQEEPRDIDDLLERALQEYQAEQKREPDFDPNHREQPADPPQVDADEDRYLTKQEAQQLHIYLAKRYGDYVKRMDHYDIATEALDRSITSFTQIRASEEKTVREVTRQRAIENKRNQTNIPVRGEASYRGYN
ncbi:MAG: Rad52/Rad22 family DNA repair protein [Trueperaceae bacterium]|nr:Rad52/Rad22 family DNA repair protein [Trueperaceae bacterium]